MGQVQKLLVNSVKTGDLSLDSQVVSLASTGKQLRPRITVAVAVALGAETHEGEVVHGATAVELLHCASLFHDDLIDGSSSRRRVPTLNATHGLRVAVLVGDLLLARGMVEYRRSGIGTEAWERALEQLTLGQLREESLTSDSDVLDVERYLSLKTASLFEAAAEIGARCASEDPRLVEAARVFGRSFGMAFQMVDDLLDVLGDERFLGKPVEQDMANGVFGVAPVHAARLNSQRFRTSLRTGAFAEAYALVRNEDSVQEALMRIDGHVRAAEEAIGTVLQDDRQSWLKGFASAYVEDALSRYVAPEYAYLIGNRWDASQHVQ